MKKNVARLAVATTVLFASFTASADTNTDTQDVNITVPEVALININDSDVTFVCALETFGSNNAGENFECNGSDGSTSAPVTSDYDITANVGSNDPTTRSITVQAGTAIDPSWSLVANVTPPTASGATVANVQITNASAQNVVTGITNVAESGIGISYTLAPAIANQAMAFSGDGTGTADTITLTYTLGDDV